MTQGKARRTPAGDPANTRELTEPALAVHRRVPCAIAQGRRPSVFTGFACAARFSMPAGVQSAAIAAVIVFATLASDRHRLESRALSDGSGERHDVRAVDIRQP